VFLQHAENISTGRPYAETSFVRDAETAELTGPPAYPPVFPLYLAALSRLGSGSEAMMKAGVVAFFMLFLVTVCGVLRRHLATKQVALVLLLLGLSPYFWNVKDQLLSDIPFAFVAYLVFWLAEVEYEGEWSRSRSLGLTLLIGLTIFIATATRTLGVTLIPTLIIFEAVKYRRLPVRAALSGLIAVGLSVIQRALSDVAEGYLAMFSLDPVRTVSNLFEYIFSLKNLFWNGYINGVAVAVWLIVTLLAIYGYRLRLREGFSILEVFAAVYLAPVVLWPFYQGIRFLIPLVPLYLFYGMVGFAALRARVNPLAATRVTAVLAILIFGSYAAAYTRVDYGEVRGGISEPEAVQLFEYVRSSGGPGDLYVFFKPRVLAFYTGARTAVNYQPGDRDELKDYYDRVGATHVIVRLGDEFLEELIRTDPRRFAEDYRNPEFAVYALVEPGAPDQRDGQ
jgi:hypothetical protein